MKTSASKLLLYAIDVSVRFLNIVIVEILSCFPYIYTIGLQNKFIKGFFLGIWHIAPNSMRANVYKALAQILLENPMQ